jgi:hypothetical protein
MLFIELFGYKSGKLYWEFDACYLIAIGDDMCNTISRRLIYRKCVAADYFYIQQEMSVAALLIMLDVYDNPEESLCAFQ